MKKNIYENIENERIISVQDLIRELIRRIGLIVICAAVFAVACGAYKYYKDTKSLEKEQDETQDTVQMEAVENLDDLEVTKAVYLSNMVDAQQEYLQNSVYMQIDPNQESKITLVYYLTSGEATEFDGVVEVYESYICDGGLAADIEESNDETEARYLNELISCNVEQNYVLNQSDLKLSDETGAVLKINVLGADETAVEKLADQVETALEQYSGTEGSVQLQKLERFYSEVTDSSLMSSKQDKLNNLISIQEKLENLEAELTTEQQQYVDLLTNKTSDVEEKTEVTSVSVSKKYVVFGAVIGIILACLYIISVYILRGTINNANDIQSVYGVRILGNLDSVPKGRFRLKTKIDKEQSQDFGYILSNVIFACRQKQADQVLMCGNPQLWKEEKRLHEIVEGMKQAGIDVIEAGSPVVSEETLEQLQDVKAVIFVEKVHTSRYSDISKEMASCLEQGAEVIGCIVLNS